jgi:DNA-binding NtrC family response regulator
MRPRILVVDDEDSILFAFRQSFEAFGYHVDCAREVEEAEALLVTYQYQAVLSDMRLTGMHGAEGLEIIGFVRERCPWTPVILLTAYSSEELEVEARRRGADAFVQKPAPLAEIGRLVTDLAGAPS